MSEAPRSDVLDLKDEALLQKLKDEGLAARFYGPTAAESVDSSLTGKALSRRQAKADAARASRHKELNQLVRDARKKRKRQEEAEAEAEPTATATKSARPPPAPLPASRRPWAPPPPTRFDRLLQLMESTPVAALGVLGRARVDGGPTPHTLSSTWCKLLRNAELAAVLGVARPGEWRNLHDRPCGGWSPTVLAEIAARSTTTPLRGYQYIDVREGLQSVPGLGEAFDKDHRFTSDNDEPRYPKQRALAWAQHCLPQQPLPEARPAYWWWLGHLEQHNFFNPGFVE